MLRIAVCDDSKSDRTELISMLSLYLKRRNLPAAITEYEMGECLVELYEEEKKPYDIVFPDII